MAACRTKEAENSDVICELSTGRLEDWTNQFVKMTEGTRAVFTVEHEELEETIHVTVNHFWNVAVTMLWPLGHETRQVADTEIMHAQNPPKEPRSPPRSPMVSVIPVRENGGFFRGKIPCRRSQGSLNTLSREVPLMLPTSWSPTRRRSRCHRFPDSTETETIEADGPCLYNALIKATDISEIKFLSNQLQL